jgi:tetratricopeptide (TPR) repeat protein
MERDLFDGGYVKKYGFLSVFCLCGGLLFAQIPAERPYWYTMEQGKLFFRAGAYGNALLSFEDARRQRRALYTRLERNFIDFLSIPEVRRLGDSLDRAEVYMAERNYSGAAEALGELYYRVPRESLNNSAARALAALGRLKDYPEAEYWIGETYRAEGELGIALSQFQKAYDQRDLLENPGFGVALKYKIADIHKIRQEYTKMERTLLEILQGDTPEDPPRDTLWTEETSSFAKNALSRTLENDGIHRFLTLYRYNNAEVEAAHRLLGFYYYASGRHSRAGEHLMFAFLIQNTVLIEEIARTQYDFTFTTLEALMAETGRNAPLAAYMDEVDYYKIAYYLGTSLFGAGKLVSARLLWNFLSTQEGAGEWMGRARTQLRSPFVERAIEMP